MNRQQRRAKAKATPAYRRGMTREDKIKALYKNGITAEDLKKNYDLGFEAGKHAAITFTFKTCYAAFIMALKREFKFGHERCRKALIAADDIVVESLSSEEAIDQAWEEVGLYLDFDDPFDRIKEVG